MWAGQGSVIVAGDGDGAGCDVEVRTEVVKEEGACVYSEEFCAVGGES